LLYECRETEGKPAHGLFKSRKNGAYNRVKIAVLAGDFPKVKAAYRAFGACLHGSYKYVLQGINKVQRNKTANA